MTKIRAGTPTTNLLLSGLVAKVFALMLVVLVLLSPAIVSVQSADVKQGASVQLDGDVIHVIWKLRIEYDDTRMANEMDDMWMAYQVNQRLDREIETKLAQMIGESVERKIGGDYDATCENLVLKVEANVGDWTDVDLEFDLKGAVRLSKTEREYNMAWKSMKVEGDIRIEEVDGRTVVASYKFTPMQSLALDWKPFSRELESWEVTQKDGYTEYYYRHKTGFPVAYETNAYNVEMLFRLPGEPTVKGNLVTYDRGYIPPYQDPFMAMLPQIVLGGVAITGISGSIYVYQRKRSKGIEKKLYKRALARKEFQDFEEALEKWGNQSKYPRLERIYGWREGSPVLNIPRMRFKEATKDHFLDEYLLGE